MRRLASLACLSVLGAACALRPSGATDRDESRVVLVKSVRLPDRHWLPWYTRFAEHSWVDFLTADGWRRAEWNSRTTAAVREIGAETAGADARWDRPVAVHATFEGDAAERIGARILALAADFPMAESYRAWPGPNSNTFVAWLADRCDIPVVLPPTAIGKDYTPWLCVGATAGGTGVELETLPVGVEIGLREGVELHVLGLTTGVGLWPPSLKLPFLPAIPGGWIAP